MITHYEDTKRKTFFSQLINLKQKGLMEEHIEDFQKLNIRVNDILEKQMVDVFIGTLKDNIQYEVFLWEPDSLEKAFRLARKIERKIMETRNPTTHDYNYGSVFSPNLPQPTRFAPQQLEEKEKKKGFVIIVIANTLKVISVLRRNYFYIDYEEEEEKDQETSKEEDIHQEPTPKKEEMNPTVSCKALERITTPQTLNIEGDIKKKKVQEVKDHIEKEEMNSTISCNVLARITTPQTINIEGHSKKKNVQEVKDHIEHQEMNLNISCNALEEITTPQTIKIGGHINKKKVIVLIDSGTINCSGKCHNVKLSMGEYVLNSPLLSIPMGGADFLLGVQWLQSLGTITFNFGEVFLKFFWEGKEVELRGIEGKPGKIINSNSMTKLLNKEQQGVIEHLCSLEDTTLKSCISPDLQNVLDNHSKVFETPKGLPPIRDYDHAIPLILGSVPPNIRRYRYPYAQRSGNSFKSCRRS
eukprot:PITA_32873